MKPFLLSAGVILLTAGLWMPLPAQETPAATATAATAPEKEPAAMEVLNKMGAYLRSLKAFQVDAEVTSEYVLDDGQKVQLAHKTNMLVRPPDGLMADTVGDTGSRAYIYNGKTFTLFARNAGFYATAPAPPNLVQLVNVLDEKYDIEIPLADLFLWGQSSSTPPDITSATDIGPGEVGGVSCEHYIYRQAGLDWQVWVQKGDYPLPRKLVLTSTTDEARPQHSSILKWNLAPAYNEGAFTFEPPAGAHKIVFASDAASSKK